MNANVEVSAELVASALGDDAVGDVHAVVGAGGAHEELALVGIFRAREREVGQAAAGAAGLP